VSEKIEVTSPSFKLQNLKKPIKLEFMLEKDFLPQLSNPDFQIFTYFKQNGKSWTKYEYEKSLKITENITTLEQI